ncbi:polysaccharide pyruvyl transferase family protein [Roseiconus nitratireducens]|uniref:Polysaccharide pyruvyl transferase family protein n=1 Tax=Roseiconus nitratireducens TaxID=2605748 RepID=A0A5M6CWJ1_9BACT|nr:polysaccharide pyruvyl transferase family protein [Roseiconus nitratireducens]KAA5538760.1 polysaccharide pyruvyl transferase family protein [Roseiconus nitratireducens]
MMIELFGGNFQNFGAQLMLQTTVHRLRTEDTSLRLAMETGKADTFARRAPLGLEAVYPPEHKCGSVRGRVVCGAFRLPKVARLIDRLGIHPPRRMSGLVDLSGYRLGDKWGPRPAEQLLKKVRRYQEEGKPVVFLPQMFGPFEQPRVAAASADLLQRADLVFARDEDSLAAVRDLGVSDQTSLLAPDLTISCAVQPIALRQRPYVCLVPNERLLDRGQAAWKEVYLDRLVRAAERVLRSGRELVVLLHSRDSGDRRLGLEILKRCEAFAPAVSLCDHDDPVYLKGVIAGSEFLVGSRFHAIVAALSSGVPAVALGWAHKYPMLLRDFGTPDLIHGPNDTPQHLDGLVDRLIDPNESAQVSSVLNAKREILVGRSEATWRKTLECLGVTPAESAEPVLSELESRQACPPTDERWRRKSA